jgi:hypothetical protein
MHFTMRADGATEARVHLVIAQVNMCATGRTDRRAGRAAHLLFTLALETDDDGVAVPFPKIVEALPQ